MEDSIINHFHEQVRSDTTTKTYDAYVQATIDYTHKELTTESFRQRLTSLFKDYPGILELLPVFFSEIDETA